MLHDCLLPNPNWGMWFVSSQRRSGRRDVGGCDRFVILTRSCQELSTDGTISTKVTQASATMGANSGALLQVLRLVLIMAEKRHGHTVTGHI